MESYKNQRYYQNPFPTVFVLPQIIYIEDTGNYHRPAHELKKFMTHPDIDHYCQKYKSGYRKNNRENLSIHLF
jgi:hypothetical protein